MNAARYLNGVRETLNGEVADAATINRLFAEGCTMQFHQPQRFSEELWRLLAALERQLGCLAGCNAYLTPKGTQGLAPHYDDVEIFVVQTEGSKRWRLHRPPADSGASTAAGGLLARCHLANQVSGDLQPADIGEPVLEVVLEAADVLYIPRGTIHQAEAQMHSSSHLTLSTYQRWSAADLVQYAVSVALANPQLQPLLAPPLKAGLPLRWLSDASLSAGDAIAMAAAAGGFGPGSMLPAAPAGSGQGSGDGKAALARQLAAACRSMAACLEDAELGPRLMLTAGDAMAEDFMRNRLPPHPEQLPPLGPAPTLADSVQCVGSSFFRLVALNGTDGGEEGCGSECEEDHDHHHPHHQGHGAHSQEEEYEHEQGDCCVPAAWVRLVSCLHNDRGSHMMSGGGDGGSDQEGSSGSEDESGSEMSSEDVEERLPGVKKAMAAATAVSRKRKPQEADAEVLGASSDSEDIEDSSGEEEEDEEEEGQEDLVFPAEFAPALVQLLGSAADAAGGGRPVPVRSSIALPEPELQLQVAVALWDAGVLRAVPAKSQQKAGKQHKAQQEQKGRGGKAEKKAAKAPPPGAASAGGGKKARRVAGSNAKKHKA